ncbi:MAG: hypothetical protein HYT76_05975 [Deltaproteobacteria bacterium]|nr:hypothetical protein [Deltaproteobacteria bacterium]
METWGFEGRRSEMPGERFGLMTYEFIRRHHVNEQALRDGGVLERLNTAEDKDDLLQKIDAAKKAINNKLDKAEDEDQIEKLEAALEELTELEGKVDETRADRADAPDHTRRGGRVRTTSEGGDDEGDPYSLLTKDEKKELQLARRDHEMAKYKRSGERMNNQNTLEELGLAGTAFNMFNGAVGGGPFMSSASVGPGGSSFGVASGGGSGHFGVAPFGGGGGGLLGIASPGVFGGPGGAMGPGDVLFNIGAPMMAGAGGLGEDIRRQNSKLEALINFLLMQILSGNTDAITSALIAISRKSKGTLILSSVAMLSAMKQYDKQQGQISDTFQKLQFDPGNPDSMANFQHQSQGLSMQLNSIAVARQMLMNQMRDVLTMTEEIGNVEKSVLDIVGQFKRHYSRFNV